jgi:exodeoxyribonuclease V gamma subunit
MAETPADPDSLEQARRRLVVEHPLQAFSPAYFVAGGDPRLRSFNRELCDALRGSGVRATEPPPGWDAAAGAEEGEEEDEEREAAGVEPFFAAPLAVPGEEWRTVSLDQLVRFFRNPCRYLLRERLGIALFREESFQSDDEPFVPDFPERQALAERLLPQAMQGLGDQELERLAMAGIEYPGGALGTALLQ